MAHGDNGVVSQSVQPLVVLEQSVDHVTATRLLQRIMVEIVLGSRVK